MALARGDGSVPEDDRLLVRTLPPAVTLLTTERGYLVGVALALHLIWDPLQPYRFVVKVQFVIRWGRLGPIVGIWGAFGWVEQAARESSRVEGPECFCS